MTEYISDVSKKLVDFLRANDLASYQIYVNCKEIADGIFPWDDLETDEKIEVMNQLADIAVEYARDIGKPTETVKALFLNDYKRDCLVRGFAFLDEETMIKELARDKVRRIMQNSNLSQTYV